MKYLLLQILDSVVLELRTTGREDEQTCCIGSRSSARNTAMYMLKFRYVMCGLLDSTILELSWGLSLTRYTLSDIADIRSSHR